MKTATTHLVYDFLNMVNIVLKLFIKGRSSLINVILITCDTVLRKKKKALMWLWSVTVNTTKRDQDT